MKDFILTNSTKFSIGVIFILMIIIIYLLTAPTRGCTDPIAINYNPAATKDNGSCNYIMGCTDPVAFNYNPAATKDDKSCKPVVVGCIANDATNYNSKANTMDNSCLYIMRKSVNYGKEKTNIYIDSKKHSNYTYTFIYSPTTKDSTKIKEKEFLNPFTKQKEKYSSTEKIIYSNDTIIIKNESSKELRNAKLFEGENIKVIEAVRGYDNKVYYIDIKDAGTNLINPRSYYKYKTKTQRYEGGIDLPYFGPKRNRFSGFLIYSKESIDVWFDVLPEKAMFSDMDIFREKTNIVRYSK